jgi:hypothetical protein
LAAELPLIRPLAVSELALALLKDVVPVVQAVHRSGVSLAIGDRGEICYLGPPGRGLLPLHVVARHQDLVQLTTLLGDAGSTRPCVRLDLGGVRVFRLELEALCLKTPAAQAAVNHVAAWLRMRPDACGLGEPVAQALSVHGRIRSTLAAVDTGAAGAADALRGLIGRGAGSTPAGDDILVGALAYAFASGTPQASLVQTMLALMPEFDRLTTAAGATYLRAAVRGAFGGDLLAFVRALPQPPAARAFHCAMRVAAHGATSGIDSLIGFVAACEAAD